MRKRTPRRRQRGGADRALQASFPDVEIKEDALIPLASTKEAPLLVWKAPLAETYITLIVFDPDAKAKAWLHWLVVNCKGVDPSTGTEIVSWEPPAPPSGTHTYSIALYTHVYPITIKTPDQRGYFNVDEFMKTHALEKQTVRTFRVKAAK
jgi:phosphatidylethanolamine-binding protein (PEBP) family uncharacterized protein